VTPAMRHNPAVEQTPVLIRPRAEGDLEPLVDGLHLVAATDGYPGQWPADPAGWLRSKDVAAAWVAQAGSDLLGQIVLRWARTQSPVRIWGEVTGAGPESLCVVSRFFVVPTGRGRAVGERLLTTATEAAAGLGRRPVLDVVESSGQAAMRLYRRLGWTEFGSFQEAWGPGGSLEHLRCFVGPDANVRLGR
jgi:ribosomal protein S18 acetylase RimI-like enzyme